MARYYSRYNHSARSYSVIDRERRNEWGEAYVVYPLVTEAEARRLTERLNNGEGVKPNGQLRQTPRRFWGDPAPGNVEVFEVLPF